MGAAVAGGVLTDMARNFVGMKSGRSAQKYGKQAARVLVSKWLNNNNLIIKS
jgi:hypothetical protein